MQGRFPSTAVRRGLSGYASRLRAGMSNYEAKMAELEEAAKRACDDRDSHEAFLFQAKSDLADIELWLSENGGEVFPNG